MKNKAIFQGTAERMRGMQVVDTGLDFSTDLVNVGMNSIVFDVKEIKYKDIFARTYLTNDTWAWSKSDVIYRDTKGKTVTGGYFTSLNIETNVFTEHYTI